MELVGFSFLFVPWCCSLPIVLVYFGVFLWSLAELPKTIHRFWVLLHQQQ